MVVEDRIEKEKARRKEQQEAIELKASIRVSFCLISILSEVTWKHVSPLVVKMAALTTKK